MKIRRPSEDICLQCHIFKNQFKYTSKQNENKSKRGGKYYESDSSERTNNTTNISGSIDVAEVEEQLVLKSASHVQQIRSSKSSSQS